MIVIHAAECDIHHGYRAATWHGAGMPCFMCSAARAPVMQSDIISVSQAPSCMSSALGMAPTHVLIQKYDLFPWHGGAVERVPGSCQVNHIVNLLSLELLLRLSLQSTPPWPLNTDRTPVPGEFVFNSTVRVHRNGRCEGPLASESHSRLPR